MPKCNCEKYKKELQEYKAKYEIAKSGLTKEERNIIIELICQEQLLHMIPKDKYETEKYNLLEMLKSKIKIV